MVAIRLGLQDSETGLLQKFERLIQQSKLWNEDHARISPPSEQRAIRVDSQLKPITNGRTPACARRFHYQRHSAQT